VCAESPIRWSTAPDPKQPAEYNPEVTVARQSPNRPEADEPTAEPAAELVEADAAPASSDAERAEDGAIDTAPAPGDNGSIWADARVTPIEIALPGGVGFTLRAYRLASELTPTEVDLTADEDPFDARERLASARTVEDDDEVVILDEEFAALVAEGDADPKARRKGAAAEDGDEPDAADFADDEADKTEEEEDEEEKVVDEEIPIFLSHRGRLIAFKSPESLVSFIRSGAPHDLAQLDSWSALAERVETTDITPAGEDSYELDLVVENLRGGHDTWDFELLIAAGEIARDLGHALHLKPVILALSAGSPLDDLDESLRSASAGGVGGFLGRRRLRKIGAQQASLGWRSIIGKISAAVDWRD
jgi:hypothetical protein